MRAVRRLSDIAKESSIQEVRQVIVPFLTELIYDESSILCELLNQIQGIINFRNDKLAGQFLPILEYLVASPDKQVRNMACDTLVQVAKKLQGQELEQDFASIIIRCALYDHHQAKLAAVMIISQTFKMKMKKLEEVLQLIQLKLFIFREFFHKFLHRSMLYLQNFSQFHLLQFILFVNYALMRIVMQKELHQQPYFAYFVFYVVDIASVQELSVVILAVITDLSLDQYWRCRYCVVECIEVLMQNCNQNERLTVIYPIYVRLCDDPEVEVRVACVNQLPEVALYIPYNLFPTHIYPLISKAVFDFSNFHTRETLAVLLPAIARALIGNGPNLVSAQEPQQSKNTDKIINQESQQQDQIQHGSTFKPLSQPQLNTSRQSGSQKSAIQNTSQIETSSSVRRRDEGIRATVAIFNSLFRADDSYEAIAAAAQELVNALYIPLDISVIFGNDINFVNFFNKRKELNDILTANVTNPQIQNKVQINEEKQFEFSPSLMSSSSSKPVSANTYQSNSSIPTQQSSSIPNQLSAAQIASVAPQTNLTNLLFNEQNLQQQDNPQRIYPSSLPQAPLDTQALVETEGTQRIRLALLRSQTLEGLWREIGEHAFIENIIPTILTLPQIAARQQNRIVIQDAQDGNNQLNPRSDSSIADKMSSASASNWQIRVSLVELVPLLVRLLGVEFVDYNISAFVMAWLRDRVYAVRQAAVKAVGEIASAAGVDWVLSSVVRQIDSLAKFESYQLRITALDLIRELALALRNPLDVASCKFVEQTISLSKDKVPNVRIAVVRTLKQIFPCVDAGTARDKIYPTLREMQSDSDIDVKNSITEE
ncbi:MAG: putative Serine/threonine-protein phosphatase 2A 65 kDa regulatory subunit A beta [Streblomastix strix]|uniref:Putative Serine/threonine-protein phosphatase 2A 65 kDa regulatory subunit A beta n=1 Tax=Streblomastix strix TaxID=222440 RepID=A0A5J4VYV1_9EUKA|nr:MAG: putative Serine/threonine-protein phosphatase 2A 65 kDa regulatory subunit A beta [Streblomastix strix]